MFTGLFIDSFVLTPYVEVSNTEVNWSIAAGPGQNYTPNVLSELDFQSIKGRGIGLEGGYIHRLNDKWALYIEAEARTSSLDSGDVRDSDYHGDNRTEEFSRSYAETSGDKDERISGAIGFKYRWFGNRGHYVTLIVGMQELDFDLDIAKGVVYIPEENRGMEIEDLKSSYDSHFESNYFAFGTEHVFQWGTLGLRIERHQLEFDSTANWNLRGEFAHPVSFSQTGEGEALLWTLCYSYPLNDSWDVYATFNDRSYEVKDGYDHSFFQDGSSYVTRLNKVELDQKAYNVGFRYIF